MTGLGFTDRLLTDAEIADLTHEALRDVTAQRILVIVPDGTRTAPIPQMFRLLHQELHHRTTALDFLIALGTHQPMNEEQVNKLLGVTPEEWQTTFSSVKVFNHEWADPATFVTLGTIPPEEIASISQGMLYESVDVRINKLVNDYDLLLICGPVFPHEVVGFSGGNKYLFPGISGPEVINISHWLGALITSFDIIGVQGVTPVRQIINRAASMVATPKLCLAMVVAQGSKQLAGLYTGTPEVAWAEAAVLSSRIHIRYLERPFARVLSIMPEMYDDIWTGAKGMYKLEPIVADGGELIIYAPHITEFSYTHGALLAEIGYHVRDYFLKQWDRFKGYPGGVLAHSTHLRGKGTYDEHGEHPRIKVTLATGISEERCHAHSLGYLDYRTIDIEQWNHREDDGILVVPKAGEILYRLLEPASITS
jgi:nickel-dependent lactate racemase